MPLSRSSVVIVLAVLAFLAGPSMVQAQQRRPPARGAQPAAPKGEPISKHNAVKGTIEAMSGSNMRVSCGANDVIMVQIAPQASMRAVGTASLDALRSGMMIRFSALVDKKNTRLKGEVAKLMIFTPSNDFALGVFTDVGGGAAGDGEFQPMVVAGVVTALKGTKLTLNVPQLSPKLKVDLTDAPTIEVNIGNISMAQQGDSITITGGSKLTQGQQTYVQAKEGTITLAQPLGGGTAKKKPTTSKAVGKKGAADEPGFDPDKPGTKRKN
jgi:hypothetical protein